MSAFIKYLPEPNLKSRARFRKEEGRKVDTAEWRWIIARRSAATFGTSASEVNGER